MSADDGCSTIALSVLVHGEAVRYNRGKTRGDDFDFKYLRGADARVYPYVSSQCFKKYWREALRTPLSPITRAKGSGGGEKNQAYTSGNPIDYLDDDLFGYMVAGADAGSDEVAEPEPESEVQVPDEIDAASEAEAFSEGDVDSWAELIKYLQLNTAAPNAVLNKKVEAAKRIRDALVSPDPSADVRSDIIDTLNSAVRDSNLASEARFKVTKKQQDSLVPGSPKLVALNKELLVKAIPKAFVKAAKRETTRRTAPVRMHALVAFCDIRTAKDFQTFSRDVAATGNNSVLNPNPVGIYSGWLKTRILVECHRIGKFYVGKNRDILAEQVAGRQKLSEADRYSRGQESVEFVDLGGDERRVRTASAIEALANVGNRQGPASGALHDGSLRPQAFIAAFMKCADSPFDFVWRSTGTGPTIDIARLRATLADWQDLFEHKVIFVGLPISEYSDDNDSVRSDVVRDAIKAAGFIPVIGTARKTLLSLAGAVRSAETLKALAQAAHDEEAGKSNRPENSVHATPTELAPAGESDLHTRENKP